MNNTYYARNEEWGTENGTDYMIIAVYRNKTLLSKERVTRQKDECWEFCINFIKGNYTAFDLLSDIVGEDSAAWQLLRPMLVQSKRAHRLSLSDRIPNVKRKEKGGSRHHQQKSGQIS